MSEMKKISRLFLVLGTALAAFVACKDDEEQDTRLYLSGSVAIETLGYESFPKYVVEGDKFTLVPSGVKTGDGPAAEIKYYFSNPFTNKKDTLKAGEKYNFAIVDSLSTFAISCTAFAVGSTDYYTTSSSLTFTVVDPQINTGSLTGFPINDEEISEEIGGKSYYLADVGGVLWMRQNLALVSEGCGHCYYDSPAMLDIMGAYYTWEEAVKVCPDGWRLPSDEDWALLCKAAGAAEASAFMDIEGAAGGLMAYTRFNGEPMWEYYRGVDVDNRTRFTSMPVGYAVVKDGKYQFDGYSKYAAYWTSSEKNGEGVYRYIYRDQNVVFAGAASKSGFAASVRCVR